MSYCFSRKVAGFCPERVLFHPGGVSSRAWLYDVPMYASGRPLDFDSSKGLALRAACAVNFCMQKFLAKTENNPLFTSETNSLHPEFSDEK